MTASDEARQHTTGRQSAHLSVRLRAESNGSTQNERPETEKHLEASVVRWEVREEVCEPYTIKALIWTPEPVSRRAILGQWAKFTFQPEPDAAERVFRGYIRKFRSQSRTADGCTYRIVMDQRLALANGPSYCATYQNKTSAEIILEVLGRSEIQPWIRVENISKNNVCIQCKTTGRICRSR